jgi:hypothetical protein
MIQTVTISLNSFFQPSEKTIFDGLASQFRGVYTVEKVDRSFASDRFMVTINNPLMANDEALKANFKSSLYNIGYESVEIVKIEKGEASSVPGGIGQAVTETVKTVQTPLIIVAVIVVALAAIYLLPKRS